MTSTTGARPVLTLTSSRSDEPTGRPHHRQRDSPGTRSGRRRHRALGVARGHSGAVVTMPLSWRTAARLTWVSASAAKPVFPRPYRSGGRTGVAPLESTSLMLDLTSESLLSPKFSTSGGGGEHEAE
jgi:hypothetical protein